MNRITDQLWIADIQSVRERPTGRFNRIVTVCQDSVEDNVGCEYDFFNMSDGPGNIYGGDSSYQLFQEAAGTVVTGLERGETVLVHCHMGQSRSAAVCIAAHAVVEGLRYNEAYNVVSDVRMIHPDGLLVDHAKRFISENEDAIDQALNWNFATEEEIGRAFRETPDEDEDADTDGVEVVYFQYRCSENDGMVTLVEPDSENLHHYDERGCETLESIIWWTVEP